MASSPSEGNDKGTALISVVWVIVLLSLLAVGVLQLVLKARQSEQLEETAVQSRYIAASAVDVFLNRYFYDNDEQAYRRADFDVLDHAVSIEVWFEKGRINLNEADESLLSALFAYHGASDDVAHALGAAIVDWRDTDDTRTASGAEASDYANAGLDYGPRNNWFESVGELQYVLGMTRNYYFCVKDLVTVYSKKSTGTDIAYAPDPLRDMYAWANKKKWDGAVWDNPDDIVSLVEAPEGGDAILGNAIRLEISIEGDDVSDYETVVRFLGRAGTERKFETALPLKRVVAQNRGDFCTTPD